MAEQYDDSNQMALERAHLRMLALSQVAGNLVDEVLAGQRNPFDPKVLEAQSAAEEAEEAYAAMLDAAPDSAFTMPPVQ